jgi:dihydrofolate reductase
MFKLDEVSSADVLLLGRKTYEGSPAWPSRTDETGFADKMRRDPRQRKLSARARMLFEGDLIDELPLMLFPVVLGAGMRLFGDTARARPFRLLDVKAVGPDGVLIATYEPKQN